MLDINYGLVLSCISCYLIGSIPNGYLLLKFYNQKDIREEGSGNVGTLNAFKVSNSKLIGLLVLFLDFIKGVIPVVLLLYVFNLDLYIVLISSIFIVVGHNYPLWLKFKGGRGLATAAGIFVVLNYGLLFTWCLIWGAIYLWKKDIMISNLIATITLLLLSPILRNFYLLFSNSHIMTTNYAFFILFTYIISSLIIIKHKKVIARFIPFTAKNI